METCSISLEEMKKIVSELKGAVSATHTENETVVFGNLLPLTVFKNCLFFVEKCSCSLSSELDMLKLDIRFHGGKISDASSDQVTHVLVHSCNKHLSLCEGEAGIGTVVAKPKFVCPDWIAASINTGLKMKQLWFQCY